VASGNPFYYIAANGATRGRVIGTSEMVSTVNNIADSLGYAFWGFSNFQGKAAGAGGNLKYLTVDGVDPLYSGPASNPGGAGSLPQCTLSGGTIGVGSCPVLTFPNIVNGGYQMWSVLRMVYDPTDPTVYALAMLHYAQAAAAITLSDFVPAKTPAGATNLQVFRSHFNQVVVTSNSDDQAPNNGLKSGVPETGGDMGGQVLTNQSELDYITDTGGLQQTNLIE
jgi:hypothetical protein